MHTALITTGCLAAGGPNDVHEEKLLPRDYSSGISVQPGAATVDYDSDDSDAALFTVNETNKGVDEKRDLQERYDCGNVVVCVDGPQKLVRRNSGFSALPPFAACINENVPGDQISFEFNAALPQSSPVTLKDAQVTLICDGPLYVLMTVDGIFFPPVLNPNIVELSGKSPSSMFSPANLAERLFRQMQMNVAGKIANACAQNPVMILALSMSERCAGSHDDFLCGSRKRQIITTGVNEVFVYGNLKTLGDRFASQALRHPSQWTRDVLIEIIGRDFFSECTGLTHLTILAHNIRSIGSNFCFGCDALGKNSIQVRNLGRFRQLLYQFQKSLSGKTARFKQRSVLLYTSCTDIAEGCINQSLVKMV